MYELLLENILVSVMVEMRMLYSYDMLLEILKE